MSWTSSSQEISLEPAGIFPNRWHEFTGRLSLSIVKPDLGNATFLPLIVKQVVEAAGAAIMVAEDDMADGDDKAEAAGVLEATPTIVLPAVSGRL